jgi:DNA replication protein DnaC
MNNQATMEKMQIMKFHGMLQAFQSTMETGVKNNFTADELVGHLVDAEWDDRKNRKTARLIQYAKFRYRAAFEEIDFISKRNLNKNEILRLSDCSWIEQHKNILITGPSGSGKSFLATALGHQACLYNYRVLYLNCMKLFSKLKHAQVDGSYIREMNKIQRTELLILDDFGIQPFDKQNRITLLEMMEDRHGLKSTIIISQVPVKNWHDIIGDKTVADAVCDRMIHTSYKIDLNTKNSLRGEKPGKNSKKS